MAAWLGHLVYWAGCAASCFFSSCALVWVATELGGDTAEWVRFLNSFLPWHTRFEPTVTELLLLAIGSWGAGRVVRYVLARD